MYMTNCKTETFKKSFFNRGTTTWNSLRREIILLSSVRSWTNVWITASQNRAVWPNLSVLKVQLLMIFKHGIPFIVLCVLYHTVVLGFNKMQLIFYTYTHVADGEWFTRPAVVYSVSIHVWMIYKRVEKLLFSTYCANSNPCLFGLPNNIC